MYLQYVSFYEQSVNCKDKKRSVTLSHFAAISKCNSVIIKMARLRFPGRPGQRIGKNYVKYRLDDMKLNMKSCIPVPCNIQMGLKLFYELFGYSDEEDEFEGFTSDDIVKAETILAIKVKRKQAIDSYIESNPDIPSGGSDFEKLLSTGTSDSETSSSSTRRQMGMRDIMRKSYDKMIKDGFCKPVHSSSLFPTKSIKKTRTSFKKKIIAHKKCRTLHAESLSVHKIPLNKPVSVLDHDQEIKATQSVDNSTHDKKSLFNSLLARAAKPIRPRGRPRLKNDISRKVKKKFPKKFKYSARNNFSLKQKKIPNIPKKSHKSKVRYKSMLRRASLLPKDNDSTCDGSEKDISPFKSNKELIPKSKKSTTVGRKKFVLPSVSVRSSRKIIPHKRYLDEGEHTIHALDSKKLIDDESHSSRSSLSVSSETISAMDGGSSPEITEFEDEKLVCDSGKRKGIFDEPLVVEGKRPWKPSLKVQMKLSEMNYEYPFALKKNADGSSGTCTSSGSFKDIIKPDMVSKYAEKMAQKPKEKILKTSECVKKNVQTIPKREVPTVVAESVDEDEGRKPEDKLEKVAAKIEKLLKSQWEGRLKDSTVRSSMKIAKLESSVVQWKSEQQQRSSNQRRTKNILRKARLQLKKRNLNLRTQKSAQSSSLTLSLENPTASPGFLEKPQKMQKLSAVNKVVPSKHISSTVGQPGNVCAVCGFSKVYFNAEKLYEQMACVPCNRFFEGFSKAPKQYFCTKEGNCSIDCFSEAKSRRICSARCKACWLKICMEKLTVSAALRGQLIKYVPRLDAPPHNPLIKDTVALLQEPLTFLGLTRTSDVNVNNVSNVNADEPQLPVNSLHSNTIISSCSTFKQTEEPLYAGRLRQTLRLARQQHTAVCPPATAARQDVSFMHKKQNRDEINKSGALKDDFARSADNLSKNCLDSKRLQREKYALQQQTENIRFPSEFSSLDGGSVTSKSMSSHDACTSDVGGNASILIEDPELPPKEDAVPKSTAKEESAPRGPRIKHVCRRAAVVLGLPRATFAEAKGKKPPFNLSALPQKEKQKLLDTEPVLATVPKPGEKPTTSKTGKQPVKKKVRKNFKVKNRVHLDLLKKSSLLIHKKQKKRKLLMKKSLKHLHKHSFKKSLKVGHKNEVKKTLKFSYKSAVKTSVKSASKSLSKQPNLKGRKVRCKQCEGCRAEDCGQCAYCLDKKKFGGRNLIKQACMFRRCVRPIPPASEKKSQKQAVADNDTEKPSGDHSNFIGSIGTSLTSSSSSPSSPDGSSCVSSCSSSSSSSSSGSSGSSSSSSSGSSSSSSSSSCSVNNLAPQSDDLGDNCASMLPMQNIATEPVFQEPVCEDDDILYEESSNIIELKNASFAPSLMYGAAMNDYKSDMSIDSVSYKNQDSNQSSSGWRGNNGREKDQYGSHGSGSPDSDDDDEDNDDDDDKKKKHYILADYWEDYDFERITSQGLALVSSQRIPIPCVCYLCGSAGEEKLIFCVLCCEPYHTFCLHESDVPNEENIDNWCCKRCQCCAVCGLKSNLLKCKKCQNTYHSECLPPHYPTKASKKKKIWMCPKCVKCKSCSTTSPASGAGLLWNFDLLLCQCCAKLTDKGNFCPVCHQCYEDDDYESQMIQCFKCNRWVHAKCDKISDEAYEILSCLPETVVYTCVNCTVEPTPVWRHAIQESLKSGLKSVLNSLINSKCARHLVSKQDENIQARPKKLSYLDCFKSQSSSDVQSSEMNNTSSELMNENIGKSNTIQATTRNVDSTDSFLEVNHGTVCNDKAEAVSVELNALRNSTDQNLKKLESQKKPSECSKNHDQSLLHEVILCVDSMLDKCVKMVDAKNKYREIDKDVSLAASLWNVVKIANSSVESNEVSHEKQKQAPDVRAVMTKTSDRAISKVIRKDSHPTDLLDIKRKVDKCKYESVAAFFEEVIHVINMKNEEAKKVYTQLTKTAFSKQIEKVFPWFKIPSSRLWDGDSSDVLPEGLLPQAVVPPYIDHIYAQYLQRAEISYEAEGTDADLIPDIRKCVLCGYLGDSKPKKCGRLLFCGQDDWIHINCALWSAEVYQQRDGSLRNVYPAISRGRLMRCEFCRQYGATVGCCVRGCPANYHFYCARKDEAVFQEDRKVFCAIHRDSVDERIIHESEFAMNHSVRVDQTGIAPKWVKKTWQSPIDVESIWIVIGSLTINKLGNLTSLSDGPNILVPVNYECTRMFWSTKNPRQRVQYTCRTVEVLNSKNSSTDVENRTIIHSSGTSPLKIPSKKVRKSEFSRRSLCTLYSKPSFRSANEKEISEKNKNEFPKPKTTQPKHCRNEIESILYRIIKKVIKRRRKEKRLRKLAYHKTSRHFSDKQMSVYRVDSSTSLENMSYSESSETTGLSSNTDVYFSDETTKDSDNSFNRKTNTDICCLKPQSPRVKNKRDCNEYGELEYHKSRNISKLFKINGCISDDEYKQLFSDSSSNTLRLQKRIYGDNLHEKTSNSTLDEIVNIVKKDQFLKKTFNNTTEKNVDINKNILSSNTQMDSLQEMNSEMLKMSDETNVIKTAKKISNKSKSYSLRRPCFRDSMKLINILNDKNITGDINENTLNHSSKKEYPFVTEKSSLYLNSVLPSHSVTETVMPIYNLETNKTLSVNESSGYSSNDDIHSMHCSAAHVPSVDVLNNHKPNGNKSAEHKTSLLKKLENGNSEINDKLVSFKNDLKLNGINPKLGCRLPNSANFAENDGNFNRSNCMETANGITKENFIESGGLNGPDSNPEQTVGPFKCGNCKRLYRTKESFVKHSETCDFIIDSSSNDDDDDDDDDESMSSSLDDSSETEMDEDGMTIDLDSEKRYLNDKEYALNGDVARICCDFQNTPSSSNSANPSSLTPLNGVADNNLSKHAISNSSTFGTGADAVRTCSYTEELSKIIRSDGPSSHASRNCSGLLNSRKSVSNAQPKPSMVCNEKHTQQVILPKSTFQQNCNMGIDITSVPMQQIYNPPPGIAEYSHVITETVIPGTTMNINPMSMSAENIANSYGVSYDNSMCANPTASVMQLPCGTIIFPPKQEAPTPILNQIPIGANSYLPPTVELTQSAQLSYVGSITITNNETMSFALNVPEQITPNFSPFQSQNIAFGQAPLMSGPIQIQPSSSIHLSTMNVQQISLQGSYPTASMEPMMFPQQTMNIPQNQIVYVDESMVPSMSTTAQAPNYLFQVPMEQEQNCAFGTYIQQPEQMQQNAVNQYSYSNDVPNVPSNQMNITPVQQKKTVKQANAAKLKHHSSDTSKNTHSQSATNIQCSNSVSVKEIKSSSLPSSNHSESLQKSDVSSTTIGDVTPITVKGDVSPNTAKTNSNIVEILRKAAEQMLNITAEMSKKKTETKVTLPVRTSPEKKTRFAHTRKVAARRAEKLKGKSPVNETPKPRSVHLNIATLKPTFSFAIPPTNTNVKSPSPQHENITKTAAPKLSKPKPGIENTMTDQYIYEEEEPSQSDESTLLAIHLRDEKLKEEQKNIPPKDKPYIMYEISSEDGFHVQSPNIHDAWEKVYDKLQDARIANHMKQITISPEDVNGLRLMGLDNPALMYLVEQLPGAENCVDYDFTFHKPSKEPEELPENSSGCCRSEPFLKQRDYDMFNFLASEHRKRPAFNPEEEEDGHKSNRRSANADLPLAMRFQNLKTISRETVGVYWSSIHGRGLFCKRNIDPGELVIEYAGEVIRSVLTDKREHIYQSKGIGCYMFRIDDDEVVDATMHGNAARFINHSCEPNCFSKVITVDGKKHIVIFALRRILKGEELTYDYKFPFEEEKIPCHCNSRRCRKYLN